MRNGTRSGATGGDGPRAFGIQDVMERLGGVTRPTVYRFLHSGELRSFRLGTRRLVSADALAEFVRGGETRVGLTWRGASRRVIVRTSART